ncbi:MAG: anti-sigma F factor [Clostridia bacterium]|nr:anti-sigma F factor [Clostridia bacterium]
MKVINEMTVSFKALSVNESFARSLVAAFCVQANPTLDEITDIKTAVSEAVTNSVVHAYPDGKGNIQINVKLYENGVLITVLDSGIGITNIEKAKQPFYTTKPNEERSGMGFTVMETFMNDVKVTRNTGRGVKVQMLKIFGESAKNVVGE